MKQSMKFIAIASISSLLSFSLQSCSETVSDQYVYLRKIDDNIRTFALTSVEQLNTVARYDDALIMVTREGCSYCEAERGRLCQYIVDTDVLVYEVDRTTYIQAYDDETNETGSYAGLYPQVSGYPTYLFYQDGKLKDSHTGIYGETYEECRKNYEQKVKPINTYLLNDFSEYVRSDGVIFSQFDTCESLEEAKMLDTIGYSTTRMDALLADEDKKTVFYSWRRCQDCKNYKQNVLYPYYQENDGKLYTYEVDGYFLLKRSDDEELEKLGLSMWAEFCSKYHLSDYPNTDKYGNTAGYVPTLVTFQGTEYTIDVFANDSAVIRNDDGTLSYSKAFHDEVKELKSSTKVKEGDSTSDDYQKAIKEIKEKANELEISLSRTYLEDALK